MAINHENDIYIYMLFQPFNSQNAFVFAIILHIKSYMKTGCFHCYIIKRVDRILRGFRRHHIIIVRSNARSIEIFSSLTSITLITRSVR